MRAIHAFQLLLSFVCGRQAMAGLLQVPNHFQSEVLTETWEFSVFFWAGQGRDNYWYDWYCFKRGVLEKLGAIATGQSLLTAHGYELWYSFRFSVCVLLHSWILLIFLSLESYMTRFGLHMAIHLSFQYSQSLNKGQSYSNIGHIYYRV